MARITSKTTITQLNKQVRELDKQFRDDVRYQWVRKIEGNSFEENAVITHTALKDYIALGNVRDQIASAAYTVGISEEQQEGLLSIVHRICRLMADLEDLYPIVAHLRDVLQKQDRADSEFRLACTKDREERMTEAEKEERAERVAHHEELCCQTH